MTIAIDWDTIHQTKQTMGIYYNEICQIELVHLKNMAAMGQGMASNNATLSFVEVSSMWKYSVRLRVGAQ